MNMKFYLIIAAAAILFSSCLKQSIPDAMLNNSSKKSTPATMSYEINGKLVAVSVPDADNQLPDYRRLECVKSNGYVFSAIISYGDFIFTFYTDSLKEEAYKYSRYFGPIAYVTTFEGRPQYVYGPTDHMTFAVTSYKSGHISGTFSGQLTPALEQAYPDNIYGIPGSVVIKNGSFTNIPVIY